MNPHQRNKVDISSLSPEEQKLFRLYGKLPNKKDLLQNKLKERKYFDSGDYAMSKAGKASDVGVTQIGREHPNPENIPHLSSSPHNNGSMSGNTGSLDANVAQQRGSISAGGGSPVKEGSYLAREQSIDDQPGTASEQSKEDEIAGGISPPPQTEGVPIIGR